MSTILQIYQFRYSTATSNLFESLQSLKVNSPQLASAPPLATALSLWEAYDLAEQRGVPCSLERLIALRTAKAANAPDASLAPWRIQAALWNQTQTDS